VGRVVHFEINVDDPQRAESFYTGAFGWQFHRWDGPTEYWLVHTGDETTPGIDGAMMRRTGSTGEVPDDAPVAAYVCTIAVDDLDRSREAVEAAGGSLASEKRAVPGVGWFCYARDPEGNVFGMMQEDAGALHPESYPRPET
jgi:predicted enzyme related to lactoylglutathione lyase